MTDVQRRYAGSLGAVLPRAGIMEADEQGVNGTPKGRFPVSNVLDMLKLGRTWPPRLRVLVAVMVLSVLNASELLAVAAGADLPVDNPAKHETRMRDCYRDLYQLMIPFQQELAEAAGLSPADIELPSTNALRTAAKMYACKLLTHGHVNSDPPKVAGEKTKQRMPQLQQLYDLLKQGWEIPGSLGRCMYFNLAHACAISPAIRAVCDSMNVSLGTIWKDMKKVFKDIYMGLIRSKKGRNCAAVVVRLLAPQSLHTSCCHICMHGVMQPSSRPVCSC